MRISDLRVNREHCVRYLQAHLDNFFPDYERPRGMPVQYGLNFTLHPVFVHEDGINYIYWGVIVRACLLGYVDETEMYSFYYADEKTRVATDEELALIERVSRHQAMKVGDDIYTGEKIDD